MASAELTSMKMSEAEVALLFAFHLIDQGAESAHVALDGASVRQRIKGELRWTFRVDDFLKSYGWKKKSDDRNHDWYGTYRKMGKEISIHAHSGVGDVVANIGKKRYYAECKKGPLSKKRGNPEYKLLREAIGQLMTSPGIKADDVLVLVAPKSEMFLKLMKKWKDLPAIKRAKINFAVTSKTEGVLFVD